MVMSHTLIITFYDKSKRLDPILLLLKEGKNVCKATTDLSDFFPASFYLYSFAIKSF
jgi:hypothetical protein